MRIPTLPGAHSSLRSRDGRGEPEHSERVGSGASSSPTRASAIINLATLATLCIATGCGFQPVYSRENRAQLASQIESVQIIAKAGTAGEIATTAAVSTGATAASGTERLAQLLKAEIQDQINPNYQHAEKLFVLNINFTETEVALFINTDGTPSRGDLMYISTYKLTRKLDGKVIDTGTFTRISSYNISQTADYATYVSREDARKRGILEMAQDYKLRLANLLPKINDPNAKPNAPVAPAKIPAGPILPAQIQQIQDGYEAHPAGL